MFLLYGIPKYVCADNILNILPWKRNNASVFRILADVKYFVKLTPHPAYPKGLMTFHT